MNPFYRNSQIFCLLLFAFALFQSGCSLFFGNIKPTEEKSNSYGIEDISITLPEWIRVDPLKESQENAENRQSGIADMTFQSQKTASTISISSACKSYDSDRQEDLTALTRELLLGVAGTTPFEEQKLTVDHNPALQTTVSGKIHQEKMMFRTVVVQRGKCVYDLMYISRPEKFKQNEKDFSRFVSSLRFK